VHQLLVERARTAWTPVRQRRGQRVLGAAQEVNELGGELAPRRGLSRTGATTDQRRERRDTDPPARRPTARIEAGGWEEGCFDRDRDAAGDDGHERRRDTEEEQVL
jgi:hypothetical protein